MQTECLTELLTDWSCFVINLCDDQSFLSSSTSSGGVVSSAAVQSVHFNFGCVGGVCEGKVWAEGSRLLKVEEMQTTVL